MPDLPHFVRLSATRGFAPAYLRYWRDIPSQNILKLYFGGNSLDMPHEPDMYEEYHGVERKRALHWLKAQSVLVELPCETPPAPSGVVCEQSVPWRDVLEPFPPGQAGALARMRAMRFRDGVIPEEDDCPVRDLTREEAAAYFDEEARRVLGMSGKDFVTDWEGGKFDADPDRPDVMYMAMLLPFVQ